VVYADLLDPIFYAFEILLANEFHGVNFPCDAFIPSGPGYTQTSSSFICNTQGAVAGQTFINGDRFIEVSYSYSWSHVWRNFGIVRLPSHNPHDPLLTSSSSGVS
jgi:ATP-binding cassette subfamily G (WHITE) protein 2 (PDR)